MNLTDQEFAEEMADLHRLADNVMLTVELIPAEEAAHWVRTQTGMES